MKALITFVLIVLVGLLLQTAMVSRMNLLSGSADLMLVLLAAWGLQERVRHAWVWGAVIGLLVGGISGAPWYIYLTVYLGVTGLSRLLTRRIWQAPLLAMFAVTSIGTFLMDLLIYFHRILFEGINLHFEDTFIQVILPSILLNFALALIIHPLMHDIANRLYPAEADA